MLITPTRSTCSSSISRTTPSVGRSIVGIKVKVSSPLHSEKRRRIASISRSPQIPLLRGKIHLALVYACPIWMHGLFQECQSQRALAAAFVSVLSAFINFGSSALLHNVRWESARARIFWRRVDHMGIFFMISGSCCPIPVLLFSNPILLVWLGFNLVSLGFGLTACLFTDAFSVSGSYSLRAACYVVVGLSNLLFLSEFRRVLSLTEEMCFYAMAAIYVVGAAAYAMKWPNPWAAVIGYHEVFHVLCLAAAGLTFKINQGVLHRTARQEFERTI
eukprot:Gregarina_sp_Poly_1__4478@NODE_2408_length_2169_cov_821_586584_g1532_i0_p2_GENE_NODE_2408_length_2169_cov_821_586584_g1532_i0NODE_2408_length_2169_cov_821_586584_g1532_i0_p2_ORF_typecomplete_len275_score18_84HlyIII/PF03006_20/7_8e24_NODE_2408_length_2169_cov_821_586584_g1532_i012852109